MQGIREWRHPLRQILPEREENTPKVMKNSWTMHGRMWEHPLLSTGRGGHLKGTLDTWLLSENVL